MATEKPVLSGMRKGYRVPVQTVEARGEATVDTTNGGHSVQPQRKEGPVVKDIILHTAVGDTTDFTVSDERVKRAIDRKFIEQVGLEDIVFELRRRNFQMIHGRGFNMVGRVIFIPASKEMMERREGSEVTRGTEGKSGTDTGSMGVSPERQDLVQNGEGAHVSESIGSAGDGETPADTDRVQGDEGGQDSIPGSEQPSTPSTDGVRGEASEEA